MARGDLDRLAERELDLGPRAGTVALVLAGMQDALDLAFGERHGLGAGTDEAGHSRRVLDQDPGLVVEIHVHEYVTGQYAFLGLNLLAVLGLDHARSEEHTSELQSR